MAQESLPAYIGSETEVRISRYRQIERESDAMGRLIGVRRLKPSEQGRMHGMLSDLDKSMVRLPDPITGEVIELEVKIQYYLAAAVCEIDRIPISFPRNRGELDAILDRLDMEGIAAAGKAVLRLNPKVADDGGEGESDPLVDAKN